MRLLIESETCISFGIELDDRQVLLKQDGGEWVILEDGGNIHRLGRRASWQKALAETLNLLTNPGRPAGGVR